MPRYDRSRFRATHNSYSGGDRGSMRSQLDRGVRGIELDFHDNGYAEIGGYRVGHLTAGAEVARGLDGNPTTTRLEDWLGLVADWSAAHDDHAPITVTLDAKDDLEDNANGGDLADLNALLERVFGDRLFTRDDRDGMGSWPQVAKLRGRILCVLSGHGANRASYRWARGATPAMAVNADGDVVLNYRSIAGDLKCWTGRVDAISGEFDWTRKTTYAWSVEELKEPCVAINDERWVVALHRSHPPEGSGFGPPRLESRVGRLLDDGRIEWFSTQSFGRGVFPSVRMDGDEIVEVHLTDDGRRRQRTRGVLDRRKREIDWKPPRATKAQTFFRAGADWSGHELRCVADSSGVIECGVEGGASGPIRLPQLAFVECRTGDEDEAIRDALFFAAEARSKAALKAARDQDLIVRAWSFDEECVTGPRVHFPAADGLTEPWYEEYVSGRDLAE